MIRVLLLFAAFAGFKPVWAGNTNPSFKLMTFNTGLVCVGPGCILAEANHPDERAPQIGRWLKAQNSDLVFLQEVFSRKHFEIIHKESGYSYVVTPDITSGLAVLSKYPVSDFGFEPFEWQGSNYHDCKRLFARVILGAVSATIALPNQRIRIVTMHQLARWQDIEGFSQPSDQITPERKWIILALRKILDRQDPHLPLVVAGDFNMNQTSDEYYFFTKTTGLQDVFRTDVESNHKNWKNFCTFCPDNPFLKELGTPGEGILDNIWVRPQSAKIEQATILHDAQPALSDHRALTATVQFVKPGPRPHETKPTQEEAAHLSEYFRKVEFSKFCWFTSPAAWTQRKLALQRLGQ